MLLTLTLRQIVAATPRARLVRIDLGGKAYPFAAGQSVMVANEGQPGRKPYSIACAPEDAERYGWLELLVGLDENSWPGSHLTLEAGTRVDVDGPLGALTFPDNPPESNLLFIAGGTGIAPLRSMLRHALATLRDRRLIVLYSARTPDEFAFEEELRELAREGRIELRLTVTRAPAGSWTGGRGRLGGRDLLALVDDPATLCFICGPPALVDEMPRLLAELGVPPSRIRIEE